MDRGPVALFGAIVAVGLGPAMWLGAQFGSIEVAPTRPPAVVGEHDAVPDRLVGGAGAGAEGTGDDAVINATPQSEIVPSSRSATASPSITSSAPTSPTAGPTTSPEPSRTSEPSTPPTESTSAPTTPATEDSYTPVPPSPPVSGPAESVDG